MTKGRTLQRRGTQFFEVRLKFHLFFVHFHLFLVRAHWFKTKTRVAARAVV